MPLSSLIVDLQVNAAGLKKGLDEANQKLEAFGKKVDKIGQVVSLSTFGNMAKQVATGLTNFVLAGAQAADQTGKLAQSAGTSTEAFSRLQYVAKLSGLSGEELAAAMGKLNKNLAEAGAGARDQTALFSALGVKVKDAAGHVRGTDAVLGDLAETFAAMPASASKSALAMEVFGKSGAALIPFLNAGRDGLAQLSAECDRLGITISGAAAQGAERFNDNLEKLHMSVQGVAARVAANLAPALAQLTDELLNSKDSSRAMKDAVEGLSATLQALVTVGLLVKGVFQAVGTVLGYVAAMAVDPMNDNVENFKALGAELTRIASSTKAEIAAVWSDESSRSPFGGFMKGAAKAALASGKSADAIMADLERQKKAGKEYDTALKSLEKTLADLKAKSEGFGAGPLAEFEARLKTGDLAQLLEKLGKKADEFKEKLRAAFEENQELERWSQLGSMNFAAQRRAGDVGHDTSDRRQAMASVGESDLGRAGLATAGFASFDQALDTLAKQTLFHSAELDRAAFLHGQGQHEAAREAELAADQAGRAAANAGRAADGFQKIAELNHEITAIIEKNKLDLEKAKRGVDRNISQRRENFDNIGENPRERMERATKGTSSFEDALGQLKDQTLYQTELLGQADQLRAAGAIEGANATELAAQEAGVAAEKAGEAADAWTQLEEFDAEAIMATIHKIVDTIGFAVTQVVGKMGDFGSIVQSGIQGFQTAGIWGAIIAVVVDLLSRFEGFQQILDIGNGFVQTALKELASGFTSLINGLRPLLGAIGMIMHSIHGVLNPILEVIGGILEGIAPIFAILGLVLEPLGGLFKSIGDVLGTVLKPVLEVITYIFIGIGLVMMGLQIAVSAVWLALVTAGDEILKAFGSHALSKARDEANQALKDNIAKAAELAKMNPGKLKELSDASADAAEAEGKKTKEVEKATTALSKLTEQFTNMPQGFRTPLASYQAMNPVGATGGLTPSLTIIVQGNLVHENQLLEMVAKQTSKARFRKYGTPVLP